MHPLYCIHAAAQQAHVAAQQATRASDDNGVNWEEVIDIRRLEEVQKSTVKFDPAVRHSAFTEQCSWLGLCADCDHITVQKRGK